MSIITTGVQNPNGDTPLVARQEIRKLAEDADLMNLYLLGLERFQALDQADPLSWFQIAGIHGRPYIPYAGTQRTGKFGGYCTHSSILFPPWHRPYLALFEQTLAAHVKEVANEFQDPAEREKYTKAAERFRVPYWDWAENADLPDFIAKQKEVTVYSPEGTRKIPNPLYQYNFHPMYSDFGDGLPDEKMWEDWLYTLRWPSNKTGNAVSLGDAMDRNLANNRLTLRDRTYNLLAQATSYEAFSNDGFLGPQTSPLYYDSLESIHGQIHGMTGKNGHMAVVDYAAFDPVFWLHHCNCDRIFAIWQALNPQSYVVPKVNDAGTFTTKPGTIEDENSLLQPFWKSHTEFWTATDVRDTRTFNYTYPELEKWSSLTPDQKRIRLRTDINSMYGKTAPFAAISPDLFNAVPPSQTGPPSQAQNQPSTTTAPPPTTTTSAPPPKTTTSAPPPKPTTSAPPPAPAATPAKQPVATAKPTGRTPPEAATPTPAHASVSPPSAAAGKQEAAPVKPTPAVSGAPASSATPHAPPSASTHEVHSAPAPAPQHPIVAQGSRPQPPHRESPGHETTGGRAPVHPTALSPRQPPQHAPRSSEGAITITGLEQKPDDGKKHYNEWIVNITVEKYAARKTFFVYIFLGDFTTDPSKWGEDPNLVGTHVIFANNMKFTGCERCRDAEEEHKLVTGTIPLTGALGDRLGKSKLSDLSPRDIVPYLKKELHWRIQDQDDKVIERTDIPSLKVSVAHVSVAVPDSISTFPTWGNGQRETEVTKGRPGGASEDD